MPTASSDAKRTRILGAARRLLVQRGFQDVVLDHVAREAGVAKGTLFLYFKNKDELISAAFADLVDQLGETLEDVARSEDEGRPLLEKAVRLVLEYFERNQDFMSQFGAGRFPGCGDRSCERLMEKFSANMSRMAAILKRSLRKGSRLDRKELEFAAVALFGLCRSANVYRLIAHDRRSLVSRTEEVVRQFLLGMEGKE